MKKQIFQLITALSVFVLLIFACSKDSSIGSKIDTQVVKFKPSDSTAINESRKRFAKALALSIGRKEVQDFLKNEAKRQKNPDNEILFLSSYKKEVSKGETFAGMLDETENSGGAVSNRNAPFFNQYLSTVDPYLSVFVYSESIDEVAVDAWNLAQVQYIAVVGSNTNEDSQTLIAYTTQGVQTTISAQDAPLDGSVIVIKGTTHYLAVEPNSDISASGAYHPETNLLNAVYSDSYYSMYDYNAVVNALNLEIFIPLPDGEPANCPRDLKNTGDELFKIKLTDCSAFKKISPWWEGTPQFRMVAALSEKAGLTFGFKTFSKVFFDKKFRFAFLTGSPWGTPICWHTLEYNYKQRKGVSLPLINWNPEITGDQIKYMWYEIDDPDLTGSVSVSISGKFSKKISASGTDRTWEVGPSVSGTILFAPKDDYLGDDFVYYCDPADGDGGMYNTGSLLFWIRQIQ